MFLKTTGYMDFPFNAPQQLRIFFKKKAATKLTHQNGPRL